nr:immunoglobulin heavy chain junction region [Macaca mulatta]MOW76634.1 immunoglobulin heavy chain junction region [Macaca mulatta]MOW76674.1 immunoglobulin heavy chain junction region [Macaca mulatta]MOW76856.1 immunoglobulin heavy chain junction region [Macaca mulatta]MOW77245.1 immunoglobulin heavy chain junction region [Macaca mulatta]
CVRDVFGAGFDYW